MIRKIASKDALLYLLLFLFIGVNQFTFPELANYGVAGDSNGGMIPALNRIHALLKSRTGNSNYHSTFVNGPTAYGAYGGAMMGSNPSGYGGMIGGGHSGAYGGGTMGWNSGAYGGGMMGWNPGAYGGGMMGWNPGAYGGGMMGWNPGAYGVGMTGGTYGAYGGAAPNGGWVNSGGSRRSHRISEEKIYKYLVQISQPAPTKMKWYRWGEAQYENSRIGQKAPFDFVTGNIGGTAAGKGLYVAEDPSASSSYGANHSIDKKALITVSAPKGTLILDLTDPKIQKNLAKVGLTNEDVFRINPPVMVKYDSFSKWWVLKTMDGVQVKDFTGKQIPTDELFEIANAIYDKPTQQFFHGKIKSTLKNRVFKSGYEDSAPQTACHPLSTWSEQPELKNLIGNFQDIEKDVSKKEYLWRFDGTCGEYYYSNNNLVLIDESVDLNKCRASQPVAHIRDAAGNCQEVVRNNPSIVVHLLQDDQCNPLKCAEGSNRVGKYNTPNAKLQFSDISFNILDDRNRGQGKIDSHFKDSKACRQALALSEATSLLCLPTSSGAARLVSSSTFRPASEIQMNNIEECFSAQKGARKDLDLVCARTGNHFVFLNYEDPFHHFPIDGLSFQKLEDCQSHLNQHSDKGFLKQKKDAEELKFKKGLNSLLAVSQSNPSNVIEEIGRRHPFLKHLLNSDAQVSEGYSVGEHSSRVLSQFEGQKSHYQLDQIRGKNHKLEPLDNFFRAVLILHDIGKSLGPTEFQHDFTMPILNHFMNKWGYSDYSITLAKELVDHDLLGEMIKGQSRPQDVAASLIGKADRLKMDPKDFLNLQTLFYVSDASSYPGLKSSVFKDEGNGKLQVISPLHAALEQLIETHKSSK